MKNKQKISILTNPIPIGRYFITENILNVARFLKRAIKPPKFNYGIYGGHYGVTRSFVEGLKSNKIPHNYNPKKLDQMSQIVVVLAGVKTLLQAIELKKCGYIKKLIAGPNIVVFSSDNI